MNKIKRIFNRRNHIPEANIAFSESASVLVYTWNSENLQDLNFAVQFLA